jgi:ubiquinone/menaquinone biosynthesis C-methylase UbiE
MTNTPKITIATLYERVASHYGQIGPQVFAHWGRRLTELTGIAEGNRVLDVATGRGASLIPASEIVGRGGLVLGIDLAAAMLQETARDLARLGVQNVALARMDAESLAFQDAVFDGLLCGFAIFLFSQPNHTLAGWSRVLRPGGRIGISVSGGGDERWRWYEELLLSYHETHQFPLSPGGGGLRKPEEIASALAKVGFVDVQIIAEEHEFAYADEKEWWEAKWTHGARYPLERMAPDVLSRFKTEVFVRLASGNQTEDIREKWRLVCVVASKPCE